MTGEKKKRNPATAQRLDFFFLPLSTDTLWLNEKKTPLILSSQHFGFPQNGSLLSFHPQFPNPFRNVSVLENNQSTFVQCCNSSVLLV